MDPLKRRKSWPQSNPRFTGAIESKSEEITQDSYETDTPKDSSQSEYSPKTNAEGTPVFSRLGQMSSTLVLTVFVILLSTFVEYYCYETLLIANPHLGRLLLSPSKTVVTVNALSASLFYLLRIVFSQAYDALRWQLASRDNGVLLSTFQALSPATSFVGVLQLLQRKGGHRKWGAQRY